jgi:lipocalin
MLGLYAYLRAFKGKWQEIQWGIYRRENCFEKRCMKSRSTFHTHQVRVSVFETGQKKRGNDP